MKQKTIIIIVAATLLVIGLISFLFMRGGGKKQSQNEQITLQFWKPFDSSDKWQEIISAYREVKPNVTVVFTQKNAETYEKDLLEAMAVDQAPDIYSVRNDWLPRYEQKISPLQINDLRALFSTYANVVFDDFLRGDKLYAIPQTVDILALYYNKQLLASAGIARPPTTWPELIEMVEKLTRFTSTGSIAQSAITLGISNNVNHSADILSLLMLQSGVEVYNPDKSSVTLTSGPTDERRENPAARSVRFYTQFADPTSRVYTWGPKQPFSTDAFASGKAAFTIGYSYLMPIIEAKDAFLDYGVTGIPQPSANGTKVNFASYWAETVWAGSKNQSEAWQFIQFATSYEQNKTYVAATNQPSSRLDVLVEQQQDLSLGVFADNVFSARSIAKPEPAEFEQILNAMIDDVALVGLNPSEAVQRASSQLKLLLQKYPLK